MSRAHPENRLPTHDRIREFYDSQTHRKLRDFVNGNDRVEAAWKTFISWMPMGCHAVLEVGCGIGAVSWRIARAFPNVNVLGLDISPRSIEIAKLLFKASNLSFREELLLRGSLDRKYDVILLMDVYEHIAPEARGELHAAVKEVLSDSGRVVLTFPSPRMLAWQRVHQQEEIQPIDEQITWREIGRFSEDIERELLVLKSVDVWHQGDYYHAVLGNVEFPAALNRIPLSLGDRIANRLANMIGSRSDPHQIDRSLRREMVQKALDLTWRD